MALDLNSKYNTFRASVPLFKIGVDDDSPDEWEYYDHGTRSSSQTSGLPTSPTSTAAAATSSGAPAARHPVLMLPPVMGTAGVYFQQLSDLAARGYRVISVNPAPYWRMRDFVDALARFMDALDLRCVHLFGASLGGFQAQAFAARYPKRVASLILCNSFVTNTYFAHNSPSLSLFFWAPGFLLRKFLIQNLPRGRMHASVAASVRFMAAQVEHVTSWRLGGRLTLNCDPFELPRLTKLPSYKVTVIEAVDTSVLPQKLRDQVAARYKHARCAAMKLGGNFPYLANPDEVSMFIAVHLRGCDTPPAVLPYPTDAEGVRAPRPLTVGIPLPDDAHVDVPLDDGDGDDGDNDDNDRGGDGGDGVDPLHGSDGVARDPLAGRRIHQHLHAQHGSEQEQRAKVAEAAEAMTDWLDQQLGSDDSGPKIAFPS